MADPKLRENDLEVKTFPLSVIYGSLTTARYARREAMRCRRPIEERLPAPRGATCKRSAADTEAPSDGGYRSRPVAAAAAISARMRGVVRAKGCLFKRLTPGEVGAEQPPLRGQPPVDTACGLYS